jgi:hypothetical protein
MSEITIDIAKFLGLVITLLGLFWGMSRRQQSTFEKHLDDKFDILQARLEQIERKEGDNGKEVAKVERKLMELRAELPEKYVRREDYIRGQSLIESKLDGLALKLENLQIREAKRD